MGAELPPGVQEQDAESQRSGWPDPLLSKGSSTAAEVTAEPGWHMPSAVPLTGRPGHREGAWLSSSSPEGLWNFLPVHHGLKAEGPWASHSAPVALCCLTCGREQ